MKYGLEIGIGIVGLLTLASFPLIASIPSDKSNPNLTPTIEVAEIDQSEDEVPENIDNAIDESTDIVGDNIENTAVAAYDFVEEVVAEPVQEDNHLDASDSTVICEIPITVYDGYYGQTANRPFSGYGINPNLRSKNTNVQFESSSPEASTSVSVVPSETQSNVSPAQTPTQPIRPTTTPKTTTPYPSVDITNSSAPIVETTTDEIKNRVIAKYELLPEDIQTHFENNGWAIHIASEKTVQEQNIFSIPIPGSIVSGLTIPFDKAIYLTDKVSDQSMNHEMGHYVDMVMLGEDGTAPSNSQEFVDIYNQEKAGFEDDDYPQSDSHEYFAETFCIYIEYAGDLQDVFPRTYQYMDSLISPYGGTKTNGAHMSEEEKDEREKNILAEGFDFDGIYGEMLKELGRELKDALKSK